MTSIAKNSKKIDRQSYVVIISYIIIILSRVFNFVCAHSNSKHFNGDPKKNPRATCVLLGGTAEPQAFVVEASETFCFFAWIVPASYLCLLANCPLAQPWMRVAPSTLGSQMTFSRRRQATCVV